jgi:two-component system response regulator RegA
MTNSAIASSERPPAIEPDQVSLDGLPDADRTLLIVDDDAPLCSRLARAMERRGFLVATAESVAQGIEAAGQQPPAFAVIDLRLGDGSGLDVVGAIRRRRAAARIVMLTGYGNIATAVAAVKAGAIDYLPKPADADAARCRRRPRIRCPPTGCAGSISSACSSNATATSRRRPGG